MRLEKTAMMEEARRMTGDSPFVLLVDYAGMSVERITDLRRKLAGVGAEMHVTKNRLLKIISAEKEWKGLEKSLIGPTATVVGSDDMATIRILRDFAREFKIPAVKAGVVDGDVLAGVELLALADLPSKDTLRSILVGTLAAPMSQLVGVMNQKLASIVYVLKAAAEKKG